VGAYTDIFNGGWEKTTLQETRMEAIQALYINLDPERARLQFIEEQLATVGLPGHRVEAVEGSKPLPSGLAGYFNPRHLMDAGALGCYASHLKAWQQIAPQRLPYALILEDDAILDPNLAGILENVIAALPPDWDMVHLASKPDRAALCMAKLAGRRALVQYSRVPPGAVGYLISAAGAEKMLRAAPRIWPLDTDTRRPWIFGLNVYGVTPPPIDHNWLVPSTIRARGPKHATPRRGIRAAFSNPIRNAKGFLFNYRRLGFYWWWRCLMSNAVRKARVVSALARRHAR
jgi:glycosyl transferase, family 25